MTSDQNDSEKTISFFKKEVNEFVQERNWLNYHTPNNLAQALSVEAGELLEIFLFKDYSVNDILKDQILKEKISDEIADVFIYLISLINSLKMDLTHIFQLKMNKNRQKYSSQEFNDGSFYKK
ncbi:MAG: nucleotide pyrophosphohydrolase [Candidatus Lokiarchaeota archaeon]|nr:nucleotide pyrophosphohydrolase [Candidatus Lokiarchaeota archaeon]